MICLVCNLCSLSAYAIVCSGDKNSHFSTWSLSDWISSTRIFRNTPSQNSQLDCLTSLLGFATENESFSDTRGRNSVVVFHPRRQIPLRFWLNSAWKSRQTATAAASSTGMLGKIIWFCKMWSSVDKEICLMSKTSALHLTCRRVLWCGYLLLVLDLKQISLSSSKLDVKHLQMSWPIILTDMTSKELLILDWQNGSNMYNYYLLKS